MSSTYISKEDLQIALKPYATSEGVKKAIEDSADEIMRSAQVQFVAIDKRFDGLEKRFDSLEKRFDGLEDKFDRLDNKFDQVIIFMKGHEKRIAHIEKHLELA